MSLHNHKQAKEIINNAFKKAENELKKKDVAIGATFSHEGKEVGIPQALMDLVMALNPKDDEKREAITKELFSTSKGNKS